MNERVPIPEDVRGLHVTVVGLGIEGESLVRYLVAHGANVTISDARPAGQLEERLLGIRDTDIRLMLGSNDPRCIDGASIVFVSQGVPLDIPVVVEARRRQIIVTSVTELFAQRWRGPVVAITGSAGKTTTTSLVDAMFTAAGIDHLLVGNIGKWPLDQLDERDTKRWAVMEISHTQLQMTTISPQVGCITNITPNHLDRFTWDEYVALKRNLISRQSQSSWAVLNFDNEEGWSAREATTARVLGFSRIRTPDRPAAFLRDGQAWLDLDGNATHLFDVTDLHLRGLHNVENALAAGASAALCGVSPMAIRQAVREFRGVAHRLEFVANIEGVSYYNDSIATAPERTLAGMHSFEEPLVLLLGGRDKHLPLEELAIECYRRCRGVVLFGESADLFERALRDHRPAGADMPVIQTDTLGAAVLEARSIAQPGDTVLLSPACTSFDAYRNFEERGTHFRDLVGAMQPAGSRNKEHV